MLQKLLEIPTKANLWAHLEILAQVVIMVVVVVVVRRLLSPFTRSLYVFIFIFTSCSKFVREQIDHCGRRRLRVMQKPRTRGKNTVTCEPRLCKDLPLPAL